MSGRPLFVRMNILTAGQAAKKLHISLKELNEWISKIKKEIDFSTRAIGFFDIPEDKYGRQGIPENFLNFYPEVPKDLFKQINNTYIEMRLKLLIECGYFSPTHTENQPLLIYLPGYSLKNKDESEQVLRYLLNEPFSFYYHQWAHWSNKNIEFNISAEINRIKNLMYLD